MAETTRIEWTDATVNFWWVRADLVTEAETRAWNAAIDATTSLPLTIIPHSPEQKAVLDAITGYRDAIRTLKKETP